MIKLAILTMDDLRAHYFIVTILRSCGEDSGVFHVIIIISIIIILIINIILVITILIIIIMITILRSCGEDSGGNQLKKSLVFHSLAPEKNETGERLMMMTILMMMALLMMMTMLMLMAMLLKVRNLWRG